MAVAYSRRVVSETNTHNSQLIEEEESAMRRLITGILSLAAGVAALGSLQAIAGDCAAPAPACNQCQPRINVRPAICCRRAPCHALRAPIIKPVCPIHVPVTCCPQRCRPATTFNTCHTVKRTCPEPKVTCCSPRPASCAAPGAVHVDPMPSVKADAVPAPPAEAAPAPKTAPAPPKEKEAVPAPPKDAA